MIEMVVVIAILVVGGGALWLGLGRSWRRVIEGEARILLTGGGTGGHVNPALAIAESIRSREPDARFLYVGVAGKAESVIVKRAGYPLRFVSSCGFPGLRPSLSLLRFICLLGLGMTQSCWILARFRPRWIIATGGYVSAPIVLTAVLLRRIGVCPAKVFLHEQNSVPGQLNALMGRWVDRVLLTFPQTLEFFQKNGAVVGYPVRSSVQLKDRDEVLHSLDFEVPPDRRVVFVFGGSQGARTINRALVDALPTLLSYRRRLFIVHGVGLAQKEGYDALNDTERLLKERLNEDQRNLLDGFYHHRRYFHNIGEIYSISDLIVCRSGAGSLNEICRLGKPALLIPKSNLPGDHQVMNARAMKQAGAAEILFEETIFEKGELREKVDGEELAARMTRLLFDPARLQRMAARSGQFFRQRANERILSEIYGDRRYDNGVSKGEQFTPLLGHGQLLERLRRAYLEAPEEYHPLRVIKDGDDLIYYRRRAEALLAHPAWPMRNLGVKLIGYTFYYDKIPMLLQMLADRTPAPRVKRLFGGDFVQVGFIRRNIVSALQVMERMDEDIENALLAAFEDPYYEVRAETCRAAVRFGTLLAGKEKWFNALLRRLQDGSFEVIMEAARALGEVGVDGRCLDALLKLKEHRQWQVRNGALEGILRLLERCVIASSAELLAEVDRFVLTAQDFKPVFAIEETYRRIVDHIGRQQKISLHDRG